MKLTAVSVEVRRSRLGMKTVKIVVTELKLVFDNRIDSNIKAIKIRICTFSAKS